MSDKTEQLNMIQNIISRMSNNSLQIKCWSVAVVVAIIALVDGTIIIFAVIPLILFLFLDAKYLSLEKDYRNLYDHVRIKNEDEIDFSMDCSNFHETMWKSVTSWSVLLFYVVLLSSVIAIGIIRCV